MKGIGKQIGQSKGVARAILLATDVSIEILSEDCPVNDERLLKQLREKYVVQPSPQSFSMFDKAVNLTGTTTMSKQVNIQSFEGKGQFLMREQGGLDWKKDGFVQIDVCRVKDAPVGRQSEFSMPWGV